MRVVRVVVLAVAAVTWARTSEAEILVIPFIGGAFHAQATLPVPGIIAPAPVDLSKSLAIGVAGVWLTSGIFGAEAELVYSPSFFERAGTLALPSSRSSSRSSTLGGNVVVAMPRSVTRDSLRPYVIGGLGAQRAIVDDVLGLNPIDRNLLVLNLGGGVIGYLGNRSGVRFDLRRTHVVHDGETPEVELSYWRATVGVTLRY